MIRDRWPHNNMQDELNRRFKIKLLETVLLSLCIVVGTLMFNPYDAYAAENYDPSDAFVEVEPAEEDIIEILETYVGACAAANCDRWAIFNGTGVSPEVLSARTCVAGFTDNVVTPELYVFADGKISNGSDWHTACWDGDEWLATTNDYMQVTATSNAVLTNTSIRRANFQCTNTVDAGYSIGSPACTAVLFGENYSPIEVNLTPSTNTGTTATGVTFTLTWEGLPEQPTHILFYPFGRDDGNCESNCPYYLHVVSGTPVGSLSGTGTITFSYKYQFAGTYSGKVLVSTDCGPFGLNTGYDSCDVYTDDIEITINGDVDRDELYDNLFQITPNGNHGIDMYVNEAQPYEWRVDTDLCEPSTVTGKRLFKGYPASAAYTDVGTILSGSSGSGSITYEYTHTQVKGKILPYIHVYCADGSYERIYNGSTLYPRGGGLAIFTAEQAQYWTTGNQVGGQSTDYSPAGSGAYFFVEKQEYERLETVRAKFEFNVNFTVGKVVIYPNAGDTSLYSEVTSGSLLNENTPQFYNYSYEDAGTYYPLIQIRSTSYNSSNPSTYRNIYLGGEQTINVSKFILVSNSIHSEIQLDNNEGIFGLDPNTFIVNLFGDSANPFLRFVESAVSVAVRSALYVASFAYGIIREAPIFSFVTDILNPIEGQTKVLPSSIFGVDLPDLGETQFTITYADEGDFGPMYEFLLAITALGVFMYLFNRFFNA